MPSELSPTFSPVPTSPTVLSVVIPVYNEIDNVHALIREVAQALRPSVHFEIIVVDDASRDGTDEVLLYTRREISELRILRHSRNAGQSAAVRSGVRAARSSLVVSLDGDGQNDPADIIKMLETKRNAPSFVHLVAGVRTVRRDGIAKRLASRTANAIRSFLLNDLTPDSGCGLKMFDRESFLELPYFDHMHRFLPALFRRAGGEVMHVPVGHRPRRAGFSKYGTLDRLFVGIADLAGVMWLARRYRFTSVAEVGVTTKVGDRHFPKDVRARGVMPGNL